MKPEEFRQGNFIEYDGRTFAIDTIANEFPTLNTDEFGIGIVDWNNIKPIPLSEKWLENLGFTIESTDFDGEQLTYYCKSFPYIGDLVQSDNKTHVYDINVGTLKLFFVHQVQNLHYSLHHTELIIKFPK